MKLLRPTSAFTLSELIVVVTILAILGTIGFISLQNYSSKSRDSSRVATVRTTVTGLTTKAMDMGKFPSPEGQISTGSINGIEVAYKGEFGENTARIIHYSLPLPKDPLTGAPLPYGVSRDGKYFQIAATLENSLSAYNSTPSSRDTLVSFSSSSHSNFLNPNSFNSLNSLNSLNPLRIEETSAATPASAKVDGSYLGYIKFSSGSATYIANFPSLIWFGTGTIDFTPPAPDARFVRDGGENVPYSFSQETPVLPETPAESVQALTNAPTATFVGTEVTGINDSLTLKTIFTGSTLQNYGTSVPTIEVVVLGTTDKLPKGPIVPVGGVCSTSTAFVCTTGTSSANNAGSCGGNSTWTCIGSLGGANTSCSLANPLCPVVGVCGTANTVATTTAPSSSPSTNLCTTGTPTAVSTNTANFSWSCTGAHGGSTASCSAPRQYTVTFDGNGGAGHTPTSKILSYNTAIGTLPTPLYTNYSFNGWFTAPTGGTQITTATPVTSTVTYSAQWTAVSLPCNLPWGGTTAHGTSATAFQAVSVVYPATCVSQSRSCTNGVLSGSYTNQACSVTYTYAWSSAAWDTCSLSCGGGAQTRTVVCQRNDGTTVADGLCSGAGVKPATSQACNTGACAVNGSCSGTPGACTIGTPASDNGATTCGTTRNWSCNGLNEGSNASCSSVNPVCVTCNLPWGGTIANGASVTAYQAASVGHPGTCVSQSRSCTNGTLAGSYTNQACSVTYTYAWNTGSWGGCTGGSCGGAGNQSRTVTCQRSDGAMVVDGFCSGVKPIMGQSCTMAACATCAGGSLTGVPSANGSNLCNYTWSSGTQGQMVVGSGTNQGTISGMCEPNGTWSYVFTCPNVGTSVPCAGGGHSNIVSADGSRICSTTWSQAYPGNTVSVTGDGMSGTATCTTSGWSFSYTCANLVTVSCSAGAIPYGNCYFAWGSKNAGQMGTINIISGQGTLGNFSAVCGSNGSWQTSGQVTCSTQHASCGGSPNTCGIGTPSNYSAGSCGTPKTWTCLGIDGGNPAYCSQANPACVTCPGGSVTVPSTTSGTCSYSWSTTTAGGSLYVNGSPKGYISGTCQSNGEWSYSYSCP